MDLSNASYRQLVSIEHALNNRPRNIPGFEFPHEVLSKLSSHVIAGVALQTRNRPLLRFNEAPTENCGEVKALLDEHIGHVADRIYELEALGKNLKALRLQCRAANPSKDCGILNRLWNTAQTRPTNSSRFSLRAKHVHGWH